MEEYNPLWEIERQSSPYLYGVEEGQRQVLVELIHTVFELRGLPLDAQSVARIEGCDSLAQLREWAQRAREVSSGAALFELSTA